MKLQLPSELLFSSIEKILPSYCEIHSAAAFVYSLAVASCLCQITKFWPKAPDRFISEDVESSSSFWSGWTRQRDLRGFTRGRVSVGSCPSEWEGAQISSQNHQETQNEIISKSHLLTATMRYTRFQHCFVLKVLQQWFSSNGESVWKACRPWTVWLTKPSWSSDPASTGSGSARRWHSAAVWEDGTMESVVWWFVWRTRPTRHLQFDCSLQARTGTERQVVCFLATGCKTPG